MQRIEIRDLQVHTIENILFVAAVVDRRELRRIEETAAVQPIGRDEIPPFLPTIRQVETCIDSAKASVRGRQGSVRGGHSLSGARRHFDHHAGLVAKFSRWGSTNYFHRFNRIKRNLIRKNFTLLVRNRLTINRKRILCVVSESMEQAVGIGSDARRSKRNQRGN